MIFVVTRSETWYTDMYLRMVTSCVKGCGAMSISKQLDKYIWDRDTPSCVYCGEPGQEVDHVIPISKGGLTVKGNLVLACRICNQRKRATITVEWLTRAYFHLLMKHEDVSCLDTYQLEVKRRAETTATHALPHARTRGPFGGR